MRQTHPRSESAMGGMLATILGALFVMFIVMFIVMAALAFGV